MKAITIIKTERGYVALAGVYEEGKTNAGDVLAFDTELDGYRNNAVLATVKAFFRDEPEADK